MLDECKVIATRIICLPRIHFDGRSWGGVKHDHLAITHKNNCVGGSPIISWIFNAPTLGADHHKSPEWEEGGGGGGGGDFSKKIPASETWPKKILQVARLMRRRPLDTDTARSLEKSKWRRIVLSHPLILCATRGPNSARSLARFHVQSDFTQVTAVCRA